MEESEQKVSKYNSGINIIMRLDILWKDTHRHSRLGDYSAWNSDLDRIWCELARDLSDKEFEAKKKDFDKFDEDLANTGKLKSIGLRKFNIPTKDKDKKDKEELEKLNSQYKHLMEKELFLRRLENHLGKGTAWDDEDEDGFD